MLNQDSLAQLKGLKTQMEAEKEHADAVVKGTQARYGFAVLADGREIFIPPNEMLKVFKAGIEADVETRDIEELTSTENSMRTLYTVRLLTGEREVPTIPNIFMEEIPIIRRPAGFATPATLLSLLIAGISAMLVSPAFGAENVESPFWTALNGWVPALVALIPLVILVAVIAVHMFTPW